MTGVEQLIKEATEYSETFNWRDESPRGIYNTSCNIIESLLAELVSRLPKEVTTETELIELSEGSVLRDSNGDVFERAGNGVEMIGADGLWSPSWVKYPAVVLSAGKAE